MDTCCGIFTTILSLFTPVYLIPFFLVCISKIVDFLLSGCTTFILICGGCNSYRHFHCKILSWITSTSSMSSGEGCALLTMDSPFHNMIHKFLLYNSPIPMPPFHLLLNIFIYGDSFLLHNESFTATSITINYAVDLLGISADYTTSVFYYSSVDISTRFFPTHAI